MDTFGAGVNGFTLIEVLIALGLSVVLLSAVYSSLSMMWRFQSAGRTEIRISQIQRSVVRMLTEDLGSIVLQIPKESSGSTTGQAADDGSSSGTTGSSTSTGSTTAGSGSTGAGSGSTGGTTGTGSTGSTGAAGGASGATAGNTTTQLSSTPLTLSGVDESGVPLTFGLVGNSESFHLTITRPARDLAYDSPYVDEAVVGRMSDLQIISWGQAPLPEGYYEPSRGVTILERPKGGLGRRAVDLYGTFEIDAILAEPDLLAPEITETTFEYFDGAIWVQEWDSQEYGALPRALRITMGFWSEPRKPIGHRGPFVAKPVITYMTHIVPIPMTVPYVEDTGT